MTKLTKRMRMIHEKIDKNKFYDINEAILLLKEVTTVKFVESVDVAINLNIDVQKSNQNVYGTTILPHGIGRPIRVAAFTQGSNVKDAKEAGAEWVGMKDLAEKIKKDKIDFDIVIATPDTMHIVSQIGQILGPRGLMPNPKVGTVTSNITETIKNFKIGQIYYRNDKNGVIHTTIGKINFDADKLKENLEALLASIKKEKPLQVKSLYIKKISISTTMGVSITLN